MNFPTTSPVAPPSASRPAFLLFFSHCPAHPSRRQIGLSGAVSFYLLRRGMAAWRDKIKLWRSLLRWKSELHMLEGANSKITRERERERTEDGRSCGRTPLQLPPRRTHQTQHVWADRFGQRTVQVALRGGAGLGDSNTSPLPVRSVRATAKPPQLLLINHMHGNAAVCHE